MPRCNLSKSVRPLLLLSREARGGTEATVKATEPSKVNQDATLQAVD